MNAAIAEALALVHTRTGMVIPPSRRAQAEREVRAAMERAGIAPRAFVERVEAGGAELDELVDRLSVGETYFFREPGQFDALRNEVLPDLRRRRGPAVTLRAWVAACASGEEAWSLAMLVRDMGEDVDILATDLSLAALRRARAAVYGAWSLRHEGRERAGRWLLPEGTQWRVDPVLARNVRFERVNLVGPYWPAARTQALDLVLCRNVLLYFDPPTVARVAERLYAALGPGGWLLTASADPRLDSHAPFSVVSTAGGFVYRREDGAVERPRAALVGAGEGAAAMDAPARSAAGPREAGPVAASAAKPSAIPAAAPEARNGASSDAGTAGASEVSDLDALASRVHALAQREGSAAALAYVDTFVSTAPLVAGHHFLAGVLLLDLGRTAEAAAALRRALFLDATSILARFLLGNAAWRLGDAAGAAAAWREVRARCDRLPADTALPLGDGATAGQLGTAASALLTRVREASG
ncbi:MAG: CheR family methyltransferase [Myxococcota bacterium]